MEAMNPTQKLWGINHKQSYFLPSENNLMSIEVDIATDKNFHWHKSPLDMHDAYIEGNMANTYHTIPINISSKPDIIENIFIEVDCSPK